MHPRSRCFLAAAVLATSVPLARAVPGDPTDGRDNLDAIVRPLADLNLEPGFDLSPEQKRQVLAARRAYAARLADWRAAHADDFRHLAQTWDDLRTGRTRLNTTRPDTTRPDTTRPDTTRPAGGFLQARAEWQRLLATSPDPTDAQVQIEAVLTDDQRRRYDAATDDDTLADGRAAAFAGTVLPLPPDGDPKAAGFYKLRVTAHVPADAGGTRSMRMTYVLFLPRGYDPAKGPYPTLVFLHGSGEAGTDGNALFNGNLGPAAEVRHHAGSAFTRNFPMILVCPQCPPRGERWDQPPVLRAALQVLDDAERKVRIDPDRLYVTGLSMGGKGTYLLAGQAPDRFAAIAPISASTLDLPLARSLRDESVWAINGSDDQDDGADHNRRMTDAARAAGGDATSSILPHRGHDVWGDYYADPAFYRWFLAHRRLTPAQRQARAAAATTRPTTAPTAAVPTPATRPGDG